MFSSNLCLLYFAQTTKKNVLSTFFGSFRTKKFVTSSNLIQSAILSRKLIKSLCCKRTHLSFVIRTWPRSTAKNNSAKAKLKNRKKWEICFQQKVRLHKPNYPTPFSVFRTLTGAVMPLLSAPKPSPSRQPIFLNKRLPMLSEPIRFAFACTSSSSSSESLFQKFCQC